MNIFKENQQEYYYQALCLARKYFSKFVLALCLRYTKQDQFVDMTAPSQRLLQAESLIWFTNSTGLVSRPEALYPHLSRNAHLKYQYSDVLQVILCWAQLLTADALTMCSCNTTAV